MTRPIKVMHIIARLNIGGAAIYVIQLAAHLNEAGYQSQLVCGQVGKAEGDMRYIADDKLLPLTIVPSLGREISLTGDLVTVYRLWRLIRRERPDIVHTHTAKAGFVGRLAAWLAGVPVIVHTFHGHVFAGYFGKNKTRVFLWLERLWARLSTAIITLSATLKHELAEVYRVAPAEKIEIIELGFELDDLATLQKGQGDFRIQFNLPTTAPLIGIVGRLVPIKNHDLFLQAAKQLADHLPAVHFVIVGDGERRAELEALAQSLGIADRVHFTGWIKDLLPVYAALDALVLCSINEGLPVSLIEAMAAGVPVISTAVGGSIDLLDNGRLGFVVPPDDTQALARGMVRALTDPAAQQTAVEARTAVRERYAIQHSVDRTVALYSRLLGRY
ncbi:MAG: glycosyltransferase family 4 protein [Chloroflexota bacterium]